MNIFKLLESRSSVRFVSAAIFFALLSACSNTVTVKVPPRVDLTEWRVIGVVDFTSDTHNELASSATQNFIMQLQSSQSGIRLLELGYKEKLLQTIQRNEIDPEAIKYIGEKYGVQAVFTGELRVTEGKPNVSFSRDMTSASAAASINGAMDAKLQETSTGATVWSNGAHGKWSIGGLTLGAGGVSDVDYTDPSEKYDEMLRELARVTTLDFRPTYEEREAK